MPRVAGNFFPFTIQAVAVTFLKVIDQFVLFCTKVDKYFSQSAIPYFPGHHFPHYFYISQRCHAVQKWPFCAKMTLNYNSSQCSPIVSLFHLDVLNYELGNMETQIGRNTCEL